MSPSYLEKAKTAKEFVLAAQARGMPHDQIRAMWERTRGTNFDDAFNEEHEMGYSDWFSGFLGGNPTGSSRRLDKSPHYSQNGIMHGRKRPPWYVQSPATPEKRPYFPNGGYSP
jgi:hypothetical protein